MMKEANDELDPEADQAQNQVQDEISASLNNEAEFGSILNTGNVGAQ